MTTFLFIIGTIGALLYLGTLTGVIGYRKLDKRDDCCGDTKKPEAKPKPFIDPITGEEWKPLEMIPDPGWSPSAGPLSYDTRVKEATPELRAALADNLPPVEEEKPDAGLAYITEKYGEKAAKHYSSGMLIEPEETPVPEPPKSFKVNIDSEGKVTGVEVPEGMTPVFNRRNHYTQVGVEFKVDGVKCRQLLSISHTEAKQLQLPQLTIPIGEPVKE